MAKNNSDNSDKNHTAESGDDDARERLLLATLAHVGSCGWGVMALRRGAADIGISPERASALFPGRGRDMIAWHSDLADRRMIDALEKVKLDELPIRRRIAEAVLIRLEQNMGHRDAVRRGLGRLLLPGPGPSAMGMVYRTVDAIWRAAGDTSTDWNFYSKRGLLAGIYLATLPVWLADRDADLATTRAFLDRRIDDVMRIPRVTSRMRGRVGQVAPAIRPVLRSLAGVIGSRCRSWPGCRRGEAAADAGPGVESAQA